MQNDDLLLSIPDNKNIISKIWVVLLISISMGSLFVIVDFDRTELLKVIQHRTDSKFFAIFIFLVILYYGIYIIRNFNAIDNIKFYKNKMIQCSTFDEELKIIEIVEVYKINPWVSNYKLPTRNSFFFKLLFLLLLPVSLTIFGLMHLTSFLALSTYYSIKKRKIKLNFKYRYLFIDKNDKFISFFIEDNDYNEVNNYIEKYLNVNLNNLKTSWYLKNKGDK